MANNTNEPTPVEMLTMEELFNEIKRRHDGVLIVTIADAKNDTEMEQFGIYAKGGLMLTIGMADFALVRARSLLHTPSREGE